LPDLSARDRGLFLAIVILAIVLRVAYLIDIKGSPYFNQPLLDSYWYDDKAKDVLEGDLLSRGGSFRVPLYTYFLAACYLVFGHSFLPPLLVQALLGAFTCGLVYVIAKRVFGQLAGVFAGFGFALYGMAIYSDGELLPTTLFILFILTSLYFLLYALERERLRDALCAGLFLGLAFLTRPEVLLLAGALAVAVIALKAKRGFRLVAVVGIVLLGTMALLGLRNREAFGEFFLFSPQGAVNLYIGNAGYADGKTPVAPPTRYPYAISADPGEDSIIIGCKQAALENVGRELNDRELAHYYTSKTLAEIGNDFPRWLGLMVKKTYYFLNSYELSDIKPIPRFIDRYSRVLRLPLLTYAIVMPLGLVGLGLVAVRRRKAAWLVSAGFLACALTSIAFFVVWRFRLPAVPFLLILGGFALSQLVAAVRGKAWKHLFSLAVPAVLLSLFSLSSLWGIRDNSGEATYITNEGAILANTGKTEQAIEVYREAIKADPADARPYYYMGKAYGSLGLISQSKEMLEMAAMINPNYRSFAFLSMGITLANQGDFAGAVPYFKRSIDADPGLALAYYNLGLSCFNLGRFAEAREALGEAVALAGDDREILLSSARLLIEIGEPDTGIAVAEAILRREPRNAKALFTVGLGLEKQGRIPEAIGQFETALRYMPSSQEMRQKLLELKAGRLKR
jgi:tetratricopeptide (TPR) repeat protein